MMRAIKGKVAAGAVLLACLFGLSGCGGGGGGGDIAGGADQGGGGVTSGTGGSGGGASASRFAGTWSGRWQAGSQGGAMQVTIDSSGRLAGQLGNDAVGAVADVSGSLNDTGEIHYRYAYPNDEGTASGSMSLDNAGRLAGNVHFQAASGASADGQMLLGRSSAQFVGPPPIASTPAAERPVISWDTLLSSVGLKSTGGIYSDLFGHLPPLTPSNLRRTNIGSLGQALYASNFAHVQERFNPVSPSDVLQPFPTPGGLLDGFLPWPGARITSGAPVALTVIRSAQSNPWAKQFQSARSKTRAAVPPVYVEFGSTGTVYFVAQYYADGSSRADFFADPTYTNYLGYVAGGVLWNNGQQGQFPARILIAYAVPIENQFVQGTLAITANDSQGATGHLDAQITRGSQTMTVSEDATTSGISGEVRSSAGGVSVDQAFARTADGSLVTAVTTSEGLKGAAVQKPDHSGAILIEDSASVKLFQFSWNSAGGGSAVYADGTTRTVASFNDWSAL